MSQPVVPDPSGPHLLATSLATAHFTRQRLGRRWISVPGAKHGSPSVGGTGTEIDDRNSRCESSAMMNTSSCHPSAPLPVGSFANNKKPAIDNEQITWSTTRSACPVALLRYLLGSDA